MTLFTIGPLHMTGISGSSRTRLIDITLIPVLVRTGVMRPVGPLEGRSLSPNTFAMLGPVKSASRITPVLTRTGIKVMSINLVLDDPEMPIIWRGPIVNSVIRQLYWDVDWGSLHYLLVDLPPGTSDAPLTEIGRASCRERV